MPHSAEAVFGQVVDAARAQGVTEVEAILGSDSSALTRFANNAIHQNVSERNTLLSVRAVIGGRTARASTNRLDRERIRGVVEQAIAITRLTGSDPELQPLADPAAYPEVNRWFESTAGSTPAGRARAVAEAIGAVEAAGQTAAGMYSTEESSFALLNSRGVNASYRETTARFSITAMAGDSSGWAKAGACDLRDLNPLDLARTAAREGRSFLKDRIGQKLFGDNITIHDDACHPLQSGAPFDGEGVPRRRLTLVDGGVVRDIAYSRQAAALAGAAPTGHGFPLPNEYGETPANIVIAGGDSSLEKMLASTERGILVTRFWYIREVDPYEKIFTGMTRDGTFLVEGGRVTAGIRNFRFNQNLVEMLSNVESLSATARASGEETFDMVVPAMKVRDFNFTEVTRF